MKDFTQEECRIALNMSKLAFHKALFFGELRANADGTINIDTVLNYAEKHHLNREKIITRMIFKTGHKEYRSSFQ